ncbi:MAG: CRISPR-associated endonuclease Cas1 [Thermodesulfobacteriota bacterium]
MELVITTPGTMLRQRDGIFLLTAGEVRKEIAPGKLSRIVISPSTAVTGQAVILAQEHNIDLVILDKFGEPVGRFWHSRLGRVAVVRRRQLEAAEEPLGLGIASGLVATKLTNQANFLKILSQKRPARKTAMWEGAERILELKLKIEKIEPEYTVEEKRNSIMGLEGAAGRIYFENLAGIMPSAYRFDGRSRRPAKDPFNAALNYCYGILYSRVEQACILAGLDPFVGFLHADNYGQTSLVFDLIEPFRIYAERTCVSLFTGRHVKDEFFDRSEHAVSLNEKGKPVVVSAVNEHLEQKIRYRRRTIRRFNVIRQEAHRIAALLATGDHDPEVVAVEEF